VELNQGVVAGDLRVLVTRTGPDISHLSAGALTRQLLFGAGWKVAVSPVNSAQVLAEKRLGRRRSAERLRSEFVRVATTRRLDRTDVATIRRLLGA
jgi:hypothetical protein